MRKIILLVITGLLLAPMTAMAAWPKVPDVEGLELNLDVHNKASLQRGARLFHNYCLSCHSAQYMRYRRMAEDLGLPEDVVVESLMFTTDNIHETMQVAMPAEDAEQWFGQAPPDLSLIARSNGPRWVYTFLHGYYQDDERPVGMNNLVVSNTSMPHVLVELQGIQRAIYDEVNGETRFAGFELVQEGSMSPREYDRAVTDLVNYLTYISEPARLQRESIGLWVLIFLALFTMLAYMLKQEYWKDVH